MHFYSQLHALLTAELPDDLLNEHSFNNGGSANTSSRDIENHSYHSAQGKFVCELIRHIIAFCTTLLLLEMNSS